MIEADSPGLFPAAKRLSSAEGRRKLKEQSRKALLGLLAPGDTVYCILRNVSRSGMSRQIDFYIDGMRCISDDVANLLDYPTTDRGALKVGGCGMDMGFSVVYSLGLELWPDGTKTPHGTRNGEPDSNGGYALKHVWL